MLCTGIHFFLVLYVLNVYLFVVIVFLRLISIQNLARHKLSQRQHLLHNWEGMQCVPSISSYIMYQLMHNLQDLFLNQMIAFTV